MRRTTTIVLLTVVFSSLAGLNHASEHNLDNLMMRKARLLWKEGKVSAFKETLQDIDVTRIKDPKLIETLVDYALIERDIELSEAYIAQLVEVGGKQESIDYAYARLAEIREDWESASTIYQKLSTQFPDNPNYQTRYAQTLYRLQLYRESKETITNGNGHKKDKTIEDRVFERGIATEGSHSIGGEFEFFDGDNLEYFIAEENAQVWAGDRTRIDIQFTQEDYEQDARTGFSAIDAYVATHEVIVHQYTSWGWRLGAGWAASYFDEEDYHEPYFDAEYSGDEFVSKFSYRNGQLVRDPIEALSVRGTKDQFTFFNRLNFFKPFELVYKFVWNEYFADRNLNPVNNESRLGDDYTHYISVELPLSEHPYFSIAYDHLNSNWDQSFSRAGEVVPYLEEQVVHAIRGYVEWDANDHFKLKASVNHGRDFERDVHRTIYSTGIDYWLEDELVLGVAYEHISGDSGTRGTGDSNIFGFSAKKLW